MIITDLIGAAITAVQEKLASDPVLVDVADRLTIARSFLVLSASSGRQVRAIARGTPDRVKAERGIEAERIEGRTGNRWILIGYGDLVVHVPTDEGRKYYALGKLWSDGTITHLRKLHENSLVLSWMVRSISSSPVMVRRTPVLKGVSKGSLIIL